MSTLHDIATKTVAAWDAGDKQYLRLLMELLRHALAQPPSDTQKAMEQALKEYLRREMPAGTIIGDTDWWAAKITRAISQPQQVEPVDGWKLVPIEPTKQMLASAENTGCPDGEGIYYPFRADEIGSAYCAMLAAAPAAQPEKMEATDDLADYLAWKFGISKDHAYDLMRNALAQQGEQPVTGWKLVPVEPTQEMLDAVVTTVDDHLLGPDAEKQYREDWAAMLAAAPAAQPVQERIKDLEEVAYALEAILQRMGDDATVGHVLELIDESKAAKAAQPVKAQRIATGWVASKDRYAVPVLFNPYSGEPRDVRDVQSDPQGLLLVPPGKVEMLASKGRPCKVGDVCVDGESSQCACSELNPPSTPSTPHPDTRKVIEQMVKAAEYFQLTNPETRVYCTRNGFGERDAEAAIQAGQQWLKEHK